MAQRDTWTAGLGMETPHMKMRLHILKALWLVTGSMFRFIDSKPEHCGLSISVATKQVQYTQMSGWYSALISTLHLLQHTLPGQVLQDMELGQEHTITRRGLRWYSPLQVCSQISMLEEQWSSAYGLLKKKVCGAQVHLLETSQTELL